MESHRVSARLLGNFPGMRWRHGDARGGAVLLGVNTTFIRNHGEEIPGALRAACGTRQLWRFDMAKVRAWQQQQERRN